MTAVSTFVSAIAFLFRRRGTIAAAALLAGSLVPAAASAAPPAAAATGGPFESMLSADAVSPGAADPRFRRLFASWSQADRGHSGAIAVPSQEPLSGFVITSGFGVRVDPFGRGAAMHPGLDLSAPEGTPVYATADGIVARAGWTGGYGNMVEIDHGRGIHTRYGHLSAILTAANNRIHRGDLIGRVGSTGRSTGNHLHYEVRLDDRAINPMPFIQGAGYVMAMRGQTVPAMVAAPSATRVALLDAAPAAPVRLAASGPSPAAAALGGPID